MSNGGTTGELVESVVILDSIFSNTPIGIKTSHTFSTTSTAGSLAIENSVFYDVPVIVKGPTATTLAGNTGTYYGRFTPSHLLLFLFVLGATRHVPSPQHAQVS
jgi:hypothetical protein